MMCPKTNPDYVMRNISGDHVLIKTLNNSVGNTSVYIFNDSGAFLWNNLSEKKSRTQLVTLLIEKEKYLRWSKRPLRKLYVFI